MNKKIENNDEAPRAVSSLPHFIPFTYAKTDVLLRSTKLDNLGDGSSPVYEKTMDSLDSLLKYFQKGNACLGILFRGQENAKWKIESKAMRLYKDSGGENDPSDLYNFCTQKLSVKMQEALKLPFKTNQESQSSEQSLAILQHYGFPTFLVDWTESLDIALFFAFNKPDIKATHVAVYAVDVGKMHALGFKDISDEDLKSKSLREHELRDGCIVRVHSFLDWRLMVQDAAFMWNDQFDPIDDLVENNAGEKANVLVKFTLPASERSDVMEYLNGRGISENSLFPDMGKICRAKESELTALLVSVTNVVEERIADS